MPKKTSAAVQKRVKNQREGMRVEAGSDLTFALPAGIRQHGSEEESTTGTTMAKKSGKNVYLVALLLFLGGVGYLAYSGFSENSVYFLNVSEAPPASSAPLPRTAFRAPKPAVTSSSGWRIRKTRPPRCGSSTREPFRIPSRPVRKSLWKVGSGLTVRFRPKRS